MKYLKSHWFWEKANLSDFFEDSAQSTELEEGFLNAMFYIDQVWISK